MSPTTRATTNQPWKVGLLAGLLSLIVYGLSPVVTVGDSFLVAPTTASIVQSGNLDINEFAGAGTSNGIGYVLDESTGDGTRTFGAIDPNLGPNEALFDYFPWTTAAIATPLFVALRLPGDVLGIDFFDPDRMAAEGDAGLLNLLGGATLTAASVMVLVMVALHLLDLADRERVNVAKIMGVAIALGTPAWSTLSRALWSQTTAVLFTSLALLGLAKMSAAEAGSHRTQALLVGISSGIALTARPTSLVIVVIAFAWMMARRRPVVPWFIAGGALVAVPWIVVNLKTWGTPAPPYFATDRAEPASYLFTGLVGNIVSPNRGLLIFSPIVILALVGLMVALRSPASAKRTLVLLMAAAFLSHLYIVSSSGETWYGGHAYGPRLMADTIPYLTVAAIPAAEQIALQQRRIAGSLVAVLIAVSVFMNAPGALAKQSSCWNEGPVNINADPSRAWDWSDMQAFAAVRVLAETGSIYDATLGGCDFR